MMGMAGFSLSYIFLVAAVALSSDHAFNAFQVASK